MENSKAAEKAGKKIKTHIYYLIKRKIEFIYYKVRYCLKEEEF
jgi:hypothetical protein